MVKVNRTLRRSVTYIMFALSTKGRADRVAAQSRMNGDWGLLRCAHGLDALILPMDRWFSMYRGP